jgi:hypothetical protein
MAPTRTIGQRAGKPLELLGGEAKFFEIVERLFEPGDPQEAASVQLSRSRWLLFLVLCENRDNL